MKALHDLVICIRCHDYPAFVLDTIDAVKQFIDPRVTRLICSVDNGNRLLGNRLATAIGCDNVFVSKSRWGWGAGLYGLLVEGIQFAEASGAFGHFMSIDYDTLFIKPEVDYSILSEIDDAHIGLVGHYCSRTIHWDTIFKRDKLKIAKVWGEIPKTYHPGEGVQGGGFLMTGAMLDRMKKVGMFGDKFKHAKSVTNIADDHLISMFCRMCGLDIKQVGKDFHIRWALDKDPFKFASEQTKAFHPTKVRNKGSADTERHIRNFFREQRGRGKLKK